MGFLSFRERIEGYRVRQPAELFSAEDRCFQPANGASQPADAADWQSRQSANAADRKFGQSVALF